jgi:hypothetical protein
MENCLYPENHSYESYDEELTKSKEYLSKLNFIYIETNSKHSFYKEISESDKRDIFINERINEGKYYS